MASSLLFIASCSRSTLNTRLAKSSQYMVLIVADLNQRSTDTSNSSSEKLLLCRSFLGRSCALSRMKSFMLEGMSRTVL
jgi:hypothetical protein